MEYGMLIKNFHISISESDGKRILTQWKFIILYLKADGVSSRKYALEALYVLWQYYALLSPRAAERMIWNRFYKSKSGLGGNYPLDLALEHYNAILKTALRLMGLNSTNRRAIDRFCKALVVNKKLINNFDRMSGMIRRCGQHKERNVTIDLVKVTNELLEANDMIYTPNLQLLS